VATQRVLEFLVVKGRVIGATVVVLLLMMVVGGYSALKWRDMKVIDAAADLTPEAKAAANGAVTTTTTTAPGDIGASTTTTTAAIAVPACSFGDEPAQGDPTTDWASIVVDTKLQLPSTFTPPDLVDASAAGFETGDQIRQIIVQDLNDLREAAKANGTPVGLISAYRSYSYQKGLFDRAVDREGEAEARKGTARPGHSEHQLGTVVDLLAAGSQSLVASFATTPTGLWLAANAAKYGFVFSYPDLPIEHACYEFEPWHLRYVGKDLAPTISASGIAPREWLLSHPAEAAPGD